MARPQYEACALIQDYFDFFFAFFFFVAMIVSLPWCVVDLRQGWFKSRALILCPICVPRPSPPYRE
jgi:hypothetical protein